MTTGWAGVAAAYRRSFGTLCAGTIPTLLEATEPAPDHLDLGCGTGELALAAARRGRRVTAVDPDPEMVSTTRATARKASVAMDVLEAALPRLPLPDGGAGAVTANFVLNHVPDPRAAMHALARVAAPSAPLAMTIWPAEPGPHLAAYGEAARAARAVPVPSAHLAPELDFARSAEGLAELAREAGLTIARAEEICWTWMVTAEDLLAGIRGGVAGPGRLHQAQTPETRSEIELRARALWAPFEDGTSRLCFPVTAVLVVAARR